jgi:hypothetical protein
MIHLFLKKSILATKVAFLFVSLHVFPSYAAESPEINALIETLKYENTIKSNIIEINNYELEKRMNVVSAQVASNPITKEKQEKRIEILNETAKVIANLLSWKEIEVPVVEVLEKELSKDEMTKLTAFFKTTAGQYYVNEFQYAAAPMAIALDKFVEQLVDRFIDEPDKPLPLVSSIDANETLASRLLIKLSLKDAAATFDKKREPFISMMATSTKPKTNKKEDIERHKKALLAFNKAYSYEQINWRHAQALSKKMDPAHIAVLLTALENSETSSLLLKFNSANIKINELVTKQVMNHEEFIKLLKKL